jgi:hypothetical protein
LQVTALQVTGWPVRVMVRGKTVTDGDKLVATKGLGAYLECARTILYSSQMFAQSANPAIAFDVAGSGVQPSSR